MASAAGKSPKKSELTVALKDLSGSGNPPEMVGGFESDKQALSFARAYVCDSVERCRVPGAFGHSVLESWKLFGEDAEVKKGDEIVWTSDEDVAQFVKIVAQDRERNWRELDPRRKKQHMDAACSCAEDEAHICGYEHDDDDEMMVGL